MSDRTKYSEIIDAIDKNVADLVSRSKREVEINNAKYVLTDLGRLKAMRKHYVMLLNQATRNTRKIPQWRG